MKFTDYPIKIEPKDGIVYKLPTADFKKGEVISAMPGYSLCYVQGKNEGSIGLMKDKTIDKENFKRAKFSLFGGLSKTDFYFIKDTFVLDLDLTNTEIHSKGFTALLLTGSVKVEVKVTYEYKLLELIRHEQAKGMDPYSVREDERNEKYMYCSTMALEDILYACASNAIKGIRESLSDKAKKEAYLLENISHAFDLYGLEVKRIVSENVKLK